MDDLAPVEQELAAADRIGDDMGRGCLERGDVRTHHEHLAAAQVDMGFGDLGFAGAQRFDLPALERESGLVTLLDEVIEARPAVLGDDARPGVRFGGRLR